MRFLVGMQMATVMTKTTMKPASLMEEIAVDLMLIQIIAMNVNVSNEKGKAKIQQHHLKVNGTRKTKYSMHII